MDGSQWSVQAGGDFNGGVSSDYLSLSQVNLDAETRESLLAVMDSLCADTFDKAQQRIYNLMAKDSFPRFLRSAHCMEAIKEF